MPDGKITANDLISPDVKQALADINSELIKLLKTVEDVAKSTVNLRSSFNQTTQTQDQTAKSAKTVSDNFNQLTQVEKEIQKIQDQTQKVIARTVAERSEENKQLIQAKVERQQQARDLQNETKLRQAYSKELTTTTKNLGEMRKELMMLKNTSFAGRPKEEIDAIQKKIGQLTKELKIQRAEVTGMGEDFAIMAGKSLKLVVAGIEGLVGSLNALGVESEVLEPLQKNIVSLIAITQALGEVQDALEARTIQVTIAKIKDGAATAYNTVVTWANTVSQNAKNAATEASTVITTQNSITTKLAAAAQWLWNAAILAFPLFWIIAGLAALTAAIVLVVNSTSKQRDEVKALKKEYEELQKQQEETAKFYEYLKKLNKERGETEIQQTLDEITANNAKLENLDKQIKTLESLKDKTKGMSLFKHVWDKEDEEKLNKAYEAYNAAIDDKTILDAKYTKEKLDLEEKANDELLKADADFTKDRLDKLKKAQEDTLKAIQIHIDERILLERKKYADRIIDENTYQQRVIEVEIEGLKKRAALYFTDKDEALKMQKEIFDKEKQLEDLKTAGKKEAVQKQVDAYETAAQKQINKAVEQYTKDLGMANLTADKKAELSQQLADKLLDIEIERVKKELALNNLTDKQKLDFQTKLDELLKQKQDALTENKLKNDEKEKKSEQEKAKLREETMKQAEDLANGIFDLGSAFRDRELSDLEKEKAAKIKAAGDNKAAIAKINAEYDKKEAAIKTRQARSDKLQALFSIALNTAMGVTNALSKVATVPLVPWIIANGAVQAAIVAAKPIPKFAKGVRGFAGGLAEVGEAGRELVSTANGVFLTPDTATRMVLPKGADVFTHSETERILREGITTDKFDSLINEQRKTRQALSNKIEKNQNITPSGWIWTTRKSNAHITHIDKYFRT